MNVDAIASGDIGVRQLPDLQIPVIDISGNGGLGYLDLVADPQKGVSLFATITFSTFVGDYVELFWNDTLVQYYSVNDEHLEGGVLSFNVLPIDIPPDSPPVSEVYYRITTQLGGNQDESPKREVWIKRTIPGDPDPDNTTPAINERLLPPEGIPDVIDTANDLTLTIAAWRNMYVGDVLTLYWGGTRHRISNPPLTQAQVDQPQTITVPAQTLVDAGDSARLMVNYEIRDRVNNWSLYSVPAFTDVQLDPNAPLGPIIVEANAAKQIDLATLGRNDVTVKIPPLSLNPLDTITLNWLGQTDKGVPVVPVIAPLPVDANGFTPEFKVLNADVVAIADGSARVFYYAQSGSAPARRSKSETVSVIGQPVQLLPPELDGAVGNIIDPQVVPASGAVVKISPYTAKDFGDQVYLLWEGVDGTGTPQFYTDDYSVGRNEENDDIIFVVPKNRLEALLNGTLRLSYTVKYIDGSSQPSEANTYRVGSAFLPMPNVDNAPGDVFDPGQYDGTVVHVVGTAAALKHNDRVTVYWTGVSPAGSASREFLVNTDNQNLSWSIPASLIEASVGEVVQVRYVVVRAAGGSQDSEIRRIQISSVGPVTGDESFETIALGNLPLNTKINFTNGLVITVTAATTGTRIVEPGIHEFGSRALFCAAGHQVKFEFGGEINKLEFGHARTTTAQNTIRFYDKANGLIMQSPLALSPGDNVALENFPLSRACVYCELIVDPAGTLIDNLIWS